MATVDRATVLDAPADAVWAAVRTPAAFRTVTRGLLTMPVLRRRIGLGTVTTAALAVFALALIGVSQWDSMVLDAVFLFILGLAWSLLSIAQLFAVQLAAPEHLRGLMNSCYALVLQGSLAAGSLAFGVLADHSGVSRSILAAGMLAMSGLLLVRRFPLAG